MITHFAGPDRATPAGLPALADELRRRYGEAFASGLAEAEIAAVGWDQPLGIGRFDATYAADGLACRRIRAILAETIAEHLPGAELEAWVDHDDPAVIDSTWLHREGRVAVDWSDDYDLGDPEGLTVRVLVDQDVDR